MPKTTLELQSADGIRFGWIAPDDVNANSLNWREHPADQLESLDAALDGVGWAGVCLVNDRRVDDGWLPLPDGEHKHADGEPCNHAVPTIVDGHARQTIATKRGSKMLAMLKSWTPDQERFILASHDSITAMATTNAQKLKALLDLAKASTPKAQALLDDLRAKAQEQIDELLEQNKEKRSDGSLLELTQVTTAPPRHSVEYGDIYSIRAANGVGSHVLVVADVFTEWSLWIQFLSYDDIETIFLPYPGPFVPLTDRAKDARLVMVQPDLYIAGHVLDRYADVYGEDAIQKLSE